MHLICKTSLLTAKNYKHLLNKTNLNLQAIALKIANTGQLRTRHSKCCLVNTTRQPLPNLLQSWLVVAMQVQTKIKKPSLNLMLRLFVRNNSCKLGPKVTAHYLLPQTLAVQANKVFQKEMKTS